MANESLIVGNSNWAVKANSLLGYAVGETSGYYVPREFTFTRNSTATYTDENGIIQTAAANIARVQNNALLLEPQRTNLVTYSEQFNNAAWTKGSATITANAAISPDGTTTADNLIEDTSTGLHRVFVVAGVTGSHTFSVYVKSNGRQYIALGAGNTGSFGILAYFDIENGVLGTVLAGTAKIENAGNGWYRCSISGVGNGAGTSVNIYLANSDNSLTYTGDGTSGVFIWGAQLEAGSYPSTYIPTTSSSATRVADDCRKTGISSLIGQTEGTLFAQVGDFPKENNGRILGISDGTLNNYVIIIKNSTNTDFAVYATNGGIAQATYLGTGSLNDNSKIAVGYANNDYVVYVNGTLVHSDSSASVPACSSVWIGQRENGSVTYIAGGSLKQAILFPTRLTNAELQSLTTL